MFEKTKKFVSEHKKELIFGVGTIIAAGIGVAIGYKVGFNKGGVKVANTVGKDVIPRVIDLSTYASYQATLTTIDEVDPKILSNLFNKMNKKEFMERVLVHIGNDDITSELMELSSGLAKATNM